MDITPALVKELRERTGAGMMDCKKALVEAKADIDLAAELLRKAGAAKADKKAGRVAAEGRVVVSTNGCFDLLHPGHVSLLAQAKAAGLPILSTPNCCAPDMIRDGVDGWIRPIRATSDYVDLLAQLAANRQMLAAAAAEAAPRDAA